LSCRDDLSQGFFAGPKEEMKGGHKCKKIKREREDGEG